ncbi:MAG: ABC transporter ATP-binding protein [Pseudonocardiales bacterium]|nr:ABC transporter ATP-binding protein [Pseudonocardiales bacterium]MBV9728995.1 ABC transporter ATP-binding protein [Pseudonocardiales bacterium]
MALNIDIAELSFSFGPMSHRLREVSLEVAEGELCCLLGPNGAGKTTLIRCLIGLLTPQSGTLRIAGHDTADLAPRQLARLVAYVPQNTTTVFPFTALDIAVMGRTPHMRITDRPSVGDRKAAQGMLDRLGIGHLARRSFAQLSGGERQLTMLARALVQEAPVLVLDEPTAALDYGNEVGILQVVSELVSDGRSVLMTTHQPNHALMWADRAVLMRDGSVVASGQADDVITAERLCHLYNVPIQLVSASMQGSQPELICMPAVRRVRRDLRDTPNHDTGLPEEGVRDEVRE